MRQVILAGVFVLAASPSFAQTDRAPEAPQAPAAEAPGGDAPAGDRQAEAAGPANLCQELLAFMQLPPPEATAPPKQDASAKQDTSSEPAAAERGATPPSGESVPPKSSEATGSAQEASGESGAAHGAPDSASGSPEPDPVGGNGTGAHKAELKSSLSAPVPKDSTATPKESVLTMAEAETLARADDVAACQSAARRLRLAGVAMPAPLLALTALDLKYQQGAAP